MDYSLPGFAIHGIFQARVLEWVAIVTTATANILRVDSLAVWTHTELVEL